MTNTTCDGCRRGLPLYLGQHAGEQELFLCTAQRYRLELEPKSTDTWYKPGIRKANEAPFVVGGESCTR